MGFISSILTGKYINALGWMIIHSFWQLIIIAGGLFVVLRLLNSKAARTRYLFCSFSMILILLVTVLTFVRGARKSAGLNQIPMVVEQSQKENRSLAESKLLNDSEILLRIKTLFFELKDAISLFVIQNQLSIILVWFTGIICKLVLFLGGLAYTRKLKIADTRLLPDELQKRFKTLISKVNIKKTVKLFESSNVDSIMVIGHLKPVILFPVCWVTGIPAPYLEALLAHELGHIIRNDYLFNLFQTIMEILFFYHPAVWWISKYLRNERENCCDDFAVSQYNKSLEFVKALACIPEIVLQKNEFAMRLAGEKNLILNRIKRLAVSHVKKSKLEMAFMSGLLFICLFFISVFWMTNLSFSNQKAEISSFKNNKNLVDNRNKVKLNGIVQDDNSLYINFENELRRDRLVKSNKFTFKLTFRELYINEKKQPGKVFNKYKQAYESLSGNKIHDNSSCLEIIKNNNDMEITLPQNKTLRELPFGEAIEEELIQDGLINIEKYQFNLTLKELYINDKKQSDEIFIKYKELYESFPGNTLSKKDAYLEIKKDEYNKYIKKSKG